MRSRSRWTISRTVGRLDAPGGQAAVDAAPEHRRHFVAVETVEETTGFSGVDHAVIDAAWVADSVVNSGLGDLVEYHPLHGHLRLQVLEQVPRNRFALAVFIGREIELRGVFQERFEFFDYGLAAIRQLIGGLETVLDINIEPLDGRSATWPTEARTS